MRYIEPNNFDILLILKQTAFLFEELKSLKLVYEQVRQ